MILSKCFWRFLKGVSIWLLLIRFRVWRRLRSNSKVLSFVLCFMSCLSLLLIILLISLNGIRWRSILLCMCCVCWRRWVLSKFLWSWRVSASTRFSVSVFRVVVWLVIVVCDILKLLILFWVIWIFLRVVLMVILLVVCVKWIFLITRTAFFFAGWCISSMRRFFWKSNYL